MAAPTTSPGPLDVYVWHARTDDVWADPARMARAIAWLQPTERARHDRYRFTSDRRMFLLGRVMARVLVGRALGTSPTAWAWREGPHGRPEIDTDTSLSFNIAHSAGMVVCALAQGHDVGVDVEDLRRPPVERALVKRYCAPAEVADIEAHGTAWHDQFLKYWTLKEAYLKARGLGISVHLRDICFSMTPSAIAVTFGPSMAGSSPDWAFTLRALDTRLLLASAAPGAGEAQRTFHVERLPDALYP